MYKYQGYRRRFIFLVFYIDDILLANNDGNLLYESKHFLFKVFDMKDLGKTSFVLNIKIYHDKDRKLLRLSQKTFVEQVLKRFNMHNCKGDKVLMV